MRIVLVGSGGREHALARGLLLSPSVTHLVAAPGNAGIAEHCVCEAVAVDDVAEQVRLARQSSADLVVIGPEVALAAGLVDALDEAGIPACGPRRSAAELESSKAFAKEVMVEAGIPTADFALFGPGEANRAAAYIDGGPRRRVIKADGLAAGKGVVVATSAEEAKLAARRMLAGELAGRLGERILVEDLVAGAELSLMALVDGERAVLLAPAQDHKRLGDGDSGPNTGGMGAVSPSGLLSDEAMRRLEQRVLAEVIHPAIRTLAAKGRPFRGVLYAGLMVGPGDALSVLEFNVRLGDPETQAILMRLRSDLGETLSQVAAGRLGAAPLVWDPRPSVCVVVSAGGYPQAPRTGMAVASLPRLELRDTDVQLFHAGTRRDADGTLRVAGGRVFGCTALGSTLEEARRRAYTLAEEVRFDGAHFRRDIGSATSPSES